MQWGKVKNILIAILLAVNLFLLGNFGMKMWQNRQDAQRLAADVEQLLSGYGLTLDDAFRLPRDSELPTLSLDRSRADEENTALAMLGAVTERIEQEDGTVRFAGADGTVEWQGDGTVQADCDTGAETPDGDAAALRLARRLFAAWGLQAEDAVLTAADGTVTMTGTVAGLPVHNRALSLRFYGTGRAALTGRWSFGTPYTTVRASGTPCIAADALLDFAARSEQKGCVLNMTVGYRMQTDSSRRTQLTPTWKITTDQGEYLVDCAKKTLIEQEE